MVSLHPQCGGKVDGLTMYTMEGSYDRSEKVA